MDIWKIIQQYLPGAVVPPQKAPPLQTTSFYQTRLTRTPGAVVRNMPSQYEAFYNDTQDTARKMVQRSAFPKDVQQSLLSEGFGAAPGMILSQQGTPSGVLRHEMLHDLMHKTGMPRNPQAMREIAEQVDPTITSRLMSSPVYQREAEKYGWTATLGDEGPAFELLTYGQDSPDLVDALVRNFSRQNRPIELGQLMKLLNAPKVTQ